MGNVDDTQQSSSWIVKEKGAKNFFVWSANRWHQFCASYNKANNWIRIVRVSHCEMVSLSFIAATLLCQDGKETIVDIQDKNVNFDIVPDDWLKNVYVGMCPLGGTYSCSRHSGEVTDFNIWSRAMSKEEMLAWTSCK